MTTLLDYNVQISKLYKQSGTNFGDGLRSGNFNFIQGNRTFAPGVDTTDLQFYSPGVTSNPAEDDPILTYTVNTGSTGTYYIPLANLLNRATFDLFGEIIASVGVVSFLRDQFGVISPFKYARNYCERLISLSSDVDFTCVISGYTMYDEKTVYDLTAQTVGGNYFTRGCPLAAISSISFVATPPFTVNVNILVGMGLPYTDWGNFSNLIFFGSSGDTNNYIPYYFQGFGSGYFLQRSFLYNQSPNNINKFNPIGRPYVVDQDPNVPNVWHGATQMFSIQNINPSLFDPNPPENNTAGFTNFNSVDLSDVRALRGGTPYSVGWVDWQG